MKPDLGKMPQFFKKIDLTGAANWVICIVGGGIFLFLTWYALRYTQYMNPAPDEIPINVHDSMSKNLLFAGLYMAVFIGLFVLEKRTPERVKQWIVRGTLALACIWIGAMGLWWVTAVDRQPVGDQAFIYGGASYFLEGEYFYFQEGGYLDYYPHQLALMAVTEVLFAIVGPFNYLACQVINVGLAVGIALLGYFIVSSMTEHFAVREMYALSMFFCLPLIFYTGWVYGDVPSIFFILLSALCLLRYEKCKMTRWLVIMVAAVVMAVLVRKNSLIMVIALCLVAGVYGLCRMDKRMLVAVLLAAVLPGLAYEGIYKVYEIRSGYEHQDGFPATTFISMGMQEKFGKYGWYTAYSRDLYISTGWDTEATSELAKEDIKARLQEFAADPAYAVNFYKEKILSQWNAPLYQCLFYGAQYWEGKEPPEGSAVHKINTEYLLDILAVCDRMQFILYGGMFLYFVLAVRKNENILQQMLAVTIIGGFFFSILWEAMARYPLPYYLATYPLAGIGYWKAFEAAAALAGKIRGRKKTGKIIEFKRVA